MDRLRDLKALLVDLDERLAAVIEPEMDRDETARSHFTRRAEGLPALEAIAADASAALEAFPCAAPLLRRRAEAYLRMVTAHGEFPKLEEAEADLRAALSIDPDHIGAATQLLNAMFVYSGLDDQDVARVAGELASKAEGWLEELVCLQIAASAYADDCTGARALYDQWVRVFGDTEGLERAKQDIADLCADQQGTVADTLGRPAGCWGPLRGWCVIPRKRSTPPIRAGEIRVKR
jgi:tetratricopeptide (TPR) repeat protein